MKKDYEVTHGLLTGWEWPSNESVMGVGVGDG